MMDAGRMNTTAAKAAGPAIAPLSLGLLIGPQPAASAPKPFPTSTAAARAPGKASSVAPAPTTSAATQPQPAKVKPSAQAPRDNSNRQYQNRRKQRQPNNEGEQGLEDPLRILVTGYPTYTQPQDLSRVFCKFGTVRVDRITNKFATLSYLDEEHAQAAVQTSKKVNVYGEFLTVRPFSDGRAAELANKQVTPKREFPRSKQKSMIVDPKKLDLSGDFLQQLERVLAGVRLTQEDVAALAVLYSDVEAALQALWPGCSAIPFGSITTGLGVKSSDADCYVHVPPQYRHPLANFVNKAKRVLQQYPDVFAEILAIPRANTPIVKFFHIPTATNCDLTFKTPLGAQNSKLIAFLLHSDPRLIPMAVLIKYWAKVHEFSGTGKLTNYALTLLIIFYLQQPPISILPSVESLQRDTKHDVVVDFWNTGFINLPDAIPKSPNTSTLSELIGGFFEFYSMFNFDEMVVCPFIGTPIKKDAFHDLNQLPSEFVRYKNNLMGKYTLPLRTNTQMCVQDPLEQCHNVASAVSGKLSAEIKAYFKFAANAYEKEKLTKCEHFFETILLEKPKIIRSKSHPEYRVNLFPRIIVTIIDPDWKPIVRELVFTIFEKMLKIKLGKVEEKVNLDTKKEKEKYMGHLTKAVWKRKQYAKLPGIQNLDFAERQARISEEILNFDKQALAVQFQLTLTYCAAPRSAVLAVRLAGGELPVFRDFGKFFISVTQGWFIELLRPHARAPALDTAAKIADTLRVLDGLREPDTDDDDDVPAADTSATAISCGSEEAAASPLPAPAAPGY